MVQSEKKSINEKERRLIQQSAFEILCVFRRLCEVNNLTYYLTAGTLLGAVRHKGFIPWDDDIDVAMPRQDFNRLSNLCVEQLPDGYYYQDGDTEENYPFFFAKIRRDHTEVYEPTLAEVSIRKGHYIDIFPLDYCPKSPVAAIRFFKIIALITWAYQGKVDSSYVCGYTKPYAKLAFRLLKVIPLFHLRRLRKLTCRFFAQGKTEGKCLCTVGGAHGYPAETYDPTWFRETVMLPFEGQEFSAPVGWHELLTNMYGDYMTPPDESERQGHFEMIGV